MITLQLNIVHPFPFLPISSVCAYEKQHLRSVFVLYSYRLCRRAIKTSEDTKFQWSLTSKAVFASQFGRDFNGLRKRGQRIGECIKTLSEEITVLSDEHNNGAGRRHAPTLYRDSTTDVQMDVKTRTGRVFFLRRPTHVRIFKPSIRNSNEGEIKCAKTFFDSISIASSVCSVFCLPLGLWIII